MSCDMLVRKQAMQPPRHSYLRASFILISVIPFFHRFRDCADPMDDLTIKKCVPSNAKDLRPMTEETARFMHKKVPEWNLVNEGGKWKLNRSWKVKTFVKGMEFLQLIAGLAEREGHHPDLHLVGWNNVMLDIWTHETGGLTDNDFILAAKIDQLNLRPLLRITPVND